MPKPSDRELVIDASSIPVDEREVKLKTMPHPEAGDGFLRYDPDSYVIEPVGHTWPIRLPSPRFAVNQPYVATCSPPVIAPDGKTIVNVGCGVHDKCRIGQMYWQKMRAKGLAPWTAILLNPSGIGEDAERCYRLYPFIRRRIVIREGHLKMGWLFITHKATVTRTRSLKRIKKTDYGDLGEALEADMNPQQIQDPVPELGPMYAHLTGDPWPKEMFREAVEEVAEHYETRAGRRYAPPPPASPARAGRGNQARKAPRAGAGSRSTGQARKAHDSVQGQDERAVRVAGQGKGRAGAKGRDEGLGVQRTGKDRPAGKAVRHGRDRAPRRNAAPAKAGRNRGAGSVEHGMGE